MLYLLPNLLDEELPLDPFLPPGVGEAVRSLQGIIAESEKGARRYLRRFLDHDSMAKMPIRLLNEHTPAAEVGALLIPIIRGEIWGLISDAGLPCIADPGAPLVLLAQSKGVKVVAFPGPSSLLLALQLSGLNGQRFAFHGYLPREVPELKAALLALEKKSSEATQLWIEAPYRSAKLALIALETLPGKSLFCIASSLTTERQRIHTRTIEQWRKSPPQLEKEPTVFLLSTQ